MKPVEEDFSDVVDDMRFEILKLVWEEVLRVEDSVEEMSFLLVDFDVFVENPDFVLATTGLH
jgi:hypothetical protein